MPTNRRHIDRETKQSEILDIAEQKLLDIGFEATTVSGIADAAGIAKNAVYWYFPSKDDILAAVLRRRRERSREHRQHEKKRSFVEQLLANLNALDELSGLTAVIHDRVKCSKAVSEVHAEFHAEADRNLRAGLLSMGISEFDAKMAAAVIVSMLEGIHLHSERRDPEARNKMVLWVINRLVSNHKDSL